MRRGAELLQDLFVSLRGGEQRVQVVQAVVLRVRQSFGDRLLVVLAIQHDRDRIQELSDAGRVVRALPLAAVGDDPDCDLGFVAEFGQLGMNRAQAQIERILAFQGYR